MPSRLYVPAVLATALMLTLVVCGAHATPTTTEIASFNFWKDAIPLFSVPLAVAAFFHSRRSDIAKAEREKREELKESIEKLIDFRAQLEDKQATSTNEQQFQAFSIRLNTRKLIYLQSAEELARNLDHVTPAEWMVLGNEHIADSNFHHAEKMYQEAVKAANPSTSSLVTQVSAQRSLAGAQMAQGEGGVARGRLTYAKSIAMLANATDPYSRYTVALTHRYWAGVEWSLGHLVETAGRLADAVSTLAQIPDGFFLRRSEARECARELCDLADQFRRAGDNATARTALQKANSALGEWADGPTYEVRGILALGAAWLAKDEQDGANAQLLLAEARKWFQMLDMANPARQWRLNSVASFPSGFAEQSAAGDGFASPPSLSVNTTIASPSFHLNQP